MIRQLNEVDEAVKNENDKNMKNEKAAEAAAIANQTPDVLRP